MSPAVQGRILKSTSLMLPGSDPHSAGVARAWLASTLSRWHASQSAIDAIVLCVSELVTNAVVHTDSSRIDVEVEQRSCGVVLSVTDEGPRAGGVVPHVEERLQSLGGRGLHLVACCSTVWGEEPSGRGSRVWAAVSADTCCDEPRVS